MRTGPRSSSQRTNGIWGKRSRTGRDRERAVPTEVGEFDHPTCKKGTWDAYDAQDDLLDDKVSEVHAGVT